MQIPPPSNYPITGLCIVADPTKCPPGYELILRSFDKNDDCDLWKDGIFRAKITRYLCYTRVFPLDQGRLNNVLGDVCIQPHADMPPAGFSLLDFTVDTREKATRKKQISAKMLPRNTTFDAITEVILLSRAKRPPTGYTLAGEMNGLLICFKMGPVPPETQNHEIPMETQNNTESSPANHSTNDYYANRPYGYGQYCPMYVQNVPHPYAVPHYHAQSTGSQPTAYVTPSTATNVGYSPYNNSSQVEGFQSSSQALVRQDSTTGTALSGVPFHLNSKFTDLDICKNMNVPEINYRSIVDINNEYDYPFRIERSAQNRLPSMDED